MRLNLHVLGEELREWNLRGHLASDHLVLGLAYPRLVDVWPDSTEPEALYLAPARVLPPRPPRRLSAAIVIGEPPDAWLTSSADVLWTDDRLIVAVKPQGLPVDADRDGVGADTLLTRLQGRWPGARLCHRLDAQTGGIVLAAADEAVWQQAFEAFRDHRGVTKRYAALAFGRFERPEGTLSAWLVKDARRGDVRVLHRDAPGAKPITTRYRAGGEVAPGLYRVALEPVTGRTHQLRAHMADFGHPLLGDDHYGDRAANRRFPGAKLCLWHEALYVSGDSPLVDYRGRRFEAPAPEWI